VAISIRPSRFRRILPFVFVFQLSVQLLLSRHAFAQSESASVSGRVTDQSNAVAPDVEIEIRNVDTGVSQITKTNGDGLYVFPYLKPGGYIMTVRKQSFRSVSVTGMTLNVQDNLSRNFVLQIGSSAESITVTAETANINTTDGTVSTVVDRNFVENMPLNGRSFQSLILLTPGVVTNSPQTSAVTGVSGEFSVNGQRTESNYYTVDGVAASGATYPYTPIYLGTSGSLPPATALGTTQSLVSVDALQEFRVLSSSYSAEYGRSPGGQFSLVTRSGTNQWHGTLFDYVRNNSFDANDWFNNYYSLPEPSERQNDFGGTLGGPVRIPGVYDGKDKTFFFFSYEGLRLVQPQAANVTYVPDVTLRENTPGTLQQVMNAFPVPNGPEVGQGQAEFIGTWSNPSSLDAVSVRLDHSVTEKLNLFFRFSDTPSHSTTRSTAAASELDSLTYGVQSYTVGASSSFSARISNEFRVNYSSNRGTGSSQIDSFGGSQAVNLAQLQGVNTTQNPVYLVSVGLDFGNYAQFQQEVTRSSQQQWNLVDALSVSMGRHQIKFGVDYRRLTLVGREASPFIGYSYYAESSVLADNADFAYSLGYLPYYPVYKNFSAFTQDSWRLNSRLTLSMGLRWEVNPAPGVTQGLKPYTTEGTDNLVTMTLGPQGSPLWQTNWHSLAPRLGAAYILHSTPGFETVVRGGIGVFYDTGQQNGSQGFSGPGFSGQCYPQFGVGCAQQAQASFPVASLSTPPVIANPPTPPYNFVYAFPSHLQLPYTWQTNMTFEQGLSKSQVLKASYVGAFGRKLLEDNEVNVGSLNPNFLYVNFFQNGLTSDYSALQLQYQARLNSRLQALASYTWSHCIDYGSENAAYPYVRGSCDYDVRHNFSAALSYELPNHFTNRAARALLHHWGFDDRFTARSGFPVALKGPCTVNPNMNNQVQCFGLDVVQRQPTYLFGSQYPGGKAINPNAFALPSGCSNLFECSASASPGNAPRNFIRGFGAWQMDLAIRRDFPIYERLKLQFRAEAFNLFNHPNFGQIDANFGETAFGQATATLARSLGGLSSLYQTGGPRSMQLALKLMF
jgi:hypothetical protein